METPVSFVSFCILLIAGGWFLRGALAGFWRDVRAPHRLGDARHRWVEIGGTWHAFTAEQLIVAHLRADRLSRPRRWRNLAIRAVVCAALAGFAMLALTGCQLIRRAPKSPPAPVVVVPPLGDSTRDEISNLKAQVSTANDLAQRAAGAVFGAQDANASNPAGLPREATAAQLAEAAAALPDPTAEQRAVKAEQNARALRGELDAVRAEIGVAVDEATRLRGELDRARQESVAIAQAAARERAEAAAKLQRQFAEMSARITAANAARDAAKLEAANQVLADQVTWLNRTAVACSGLAVLSFGLAAAFGGIMAIRSVGPFSAIIGFAGLCAFGLAQIVGAWWFKWAILAIVAIILGICAWWVWRHHKRGTLAADAAAKLTKTKAAFAPVVKTLDEVYDEGEAGVRDLMDKLIFSRLSSRMNSSEKATIHEVRAETPTPPTV